MNIPHSLHKAVIALAIAAGTSAAAYAAVLSPEQALERALAGSRQAAPAHSAVSYSLSYTDSEAGRNTLYVFTPQQADRTGFLVVSADDCADAILGYSDSADFDPTDIPAPMAWWLSEYARQIEAARAASVIRAIERPERESIAPLVTTTWNQDAPYNAMCPEVNGNRSMTGCVATAMAQIMNSHRWPEQGVGAHQYYWNNSWLSLDFSKINFDWDNMRDSYADGVGTERQKSAVATLMYACGVSVDMIYSPVQSGTADVYVASALVDYFNYDVGVRYAERDYFGLLDWEDFIYNQLRDFGPVQYSGSSSMGGHSFVCDGYSTDGYFHINWGWGGISDGYFRLAALDPPMQGIGGADSGFNYNQAVIANISKPKAKSEMYVNLMMDRGFGVSVTKTATATKPGDQIVVDKRVINYSIGTASGSLGVRFTNTETGEVKYGTAPTRFSIPVLTPLSSYYTQIPSNLKTGTYELTPVWCGMDGVWHDVPVKLSTVQKVIMTVKYGECTFANADDGAIEVTDVELHTPVYLGNLFRLTAKVANPGDTEFVGQLVPTLASGSSPIAKADPIAVDLLPGESMDVDFTGIFNHFASAALPNPGKYTLYIVKEATNQIVSQGIEVELKGVPENTSLTVNSFTVEGDVNAVAPANITFTGSVTCTEGYLGRNLTVVIFPYKAGQVSSIGYFSTDNIFVEAGGTADFRAGGVLAAAEHGQRYFAVLYDGQTELTDKSQVVIFTVDKSAGIDAVVAPAATSTRVFTPAGIFVGEFDCDPADASLAPGLYILRQGDTSRKLLVK